MRTIRAAFGDNLYILGDDVYVITTDGNGYRSKSRVRLISGTNDSSIIGFHPLKTHCTVCSVSATFAEFVGVKKSDIMKESDYLKLKEQVGPIPWTNRSPTKKGQYLLVAEGVDMQVVNVHYSIGYDRLFTEVSDKMNREYRLVYLDQIKNGYWIGPIARNPLEN